MNGNFTHFWFLITAIWYTASGILHDVFVLKQHKESYNRDLLRLLMDGHVLILSGIVLGIAFFLFKHNIQFAAYLGIAVAVLMLLYCAMIFPFLKSIGTIAISLILLGVSIYLLANK
jgi:hypothetical protein